MAAVATLSASALLWIVRPPLRELLPLTALSTGRLAGYADVVGWLGLLLVCLSETRRLSWLQGKPTVREPRLPSRRARRKSAPLALPRLTPRMTLTAHAGADYAMPRRVQQAELRSEAVSRNEPKEDDRAAVLLLGPLTITGARTKRYGLRAGALELVAYLALHPHGATRDELLEAFWPGQEPRKTRGRLYQATRDARRLLGEKTIIRTKERYLLDRRQVAVDVDELSVTLEGAERTIEPPAKVALLARALSFFRGEPLAGVDYHWASPHIGHLRSVYVDLLAEIGRMHLNAGDGVSALEIAERGLEVDQLNEELWRLALKAEGAVGLRSAIEARYERLRILLDQRLGLTPASETRSLYRQLLAQQ